MSIVEHRNSTLKQPTPNTYPDHESISHTIRALGDWKSRGMLSQDEAELWQWILASMYLSATIDETLRDTFDVLDTTLCQVDRELKKTLLAGVE